MNLFKKITSVTTASLLVLSLASAVPARRVSAASDVTINLDEEHQTITGFGGMNHPEWTGKDLTDAQRKTAFGNGENELGLTVLRIFVNPDKTQWNKALPTAQYASEHGVTVFASPWEPPAELAEQLNTKTGKLHLPKSNYAAYAQHLNDFGTYMKNNGVDLYSISVQNEPDFAEDWTYWSTDETTDFLANYADKITSTRVMSPESFQYAPENASWVPDGGKKFYTKILNNEKAFANCDLFGTHFYGTARDWMDFPALENCGKPIWMTEVYVPNSEADSNMRWPESLQVAENIHNGLTIGNMSAYVWWYIRRNYGPMNEDGSISKRGYCMAQYSKFVRPGYIRVGATEQPNENVYVSAYKNSNDKVTIVAVNKGTTEYTQNFKINDVSISNVDRYRTSQSENLSPTLNMDFSENSFYAQLPAESVSTFVVTVSDGKPVEPDENGYYFHDTFEYSVCDWSARGESKVGMSGRFPYKDTNALIISERTAVWNGAQKELSSKIFKPGSKYSFSTVVTFLEPESLSNEKFNLTFQYKDSNGDTKYLNIDNKTAIRGNYVQLSNTGFTIPEDAASDMMLVVESTEENVNFYIDEAIAAAEGTKIDGPSEIKYVLGDIDSNGIINVYDVVLSKRGFINGFKNNAAMLAADVNQNGKVDADDISQLQSYIINRITEFTKSEPIPDEPVNDPTKYMETFKSSVTEYAAAGITEEKAGIEYGNLTKYKYYSTTRERDVNVNVLLPPGYNENEKYPVLYALHGYWENEDSLAAMSSAKTMLGNLIAEGKAEKMIIVFPYIYTSKTQTECSGLDLQNSLNYDNFINDLTTDLMPYIESTFSVKTGRDNTAITGFSMGGRESLFIGLTRNDLFSYVGAACPAPGLTPGTDLSMHPGQLQENDLKPQKGEPYMIFITGGTNDTVVFDQPASYEKILTKNGVNHIYHSVTNGAHSASSVQPHFYNYLRAIFKAN